MNSRKVIEAYHATRSRAEALHPAVFTPRGTAPVPLKVGIAYQMSALRDEVGEAALRHFMRAWTGRPEYLAVLVAGTPRRGLDGQEDGAVSDVEEEGARQRMSVQKVAVRKADLATLDPETRARRERQSAMAKERNALAAAGNAEKTAEAKPE